MKPTDLLSLHASKNRLSGKCYVGYMSATGFLNYLLEILPLALDHAGCEAPRMELGR